MKAIFMLSLFLISILSAKSKTGSEVFYMRSKGADIQINLRGNIESDTIIVLIPGWPRLGSIYSIESAFKKMEKIYSIVYWDFRGVGDSKGNPSESTLTMEQYVEDISLLVDILFTRFNKPNIYVLAHSFGGESSGKYLVKYSNLNKVKGLISVDANLDNRALFSVLREELLSFTQNKIDCYWKAVDQWLTNLRTYSTNDMDKMYSYAIEAEIIVNNYIYDSYFLLYKSLTESFGLTNIIMTNYYSRGCYKDFQLFVPNLEELNTPLLIIHGKLALGGRGEKVGQMILNRVGTEASLKRLSVFSKSGHFPNLTEPDKFIAEVIDFITFINGVER